MHFKFMYIISIFTFSTIINRECVEYQQFACNSTLVWRGRKCKDADEIGGQRRQQLGLQTLIGWRCPLHRGECLHSMEVERGVEWSYVLK